MAKQVNKDVYQRLIKDRGLLTKEVDKEVLGFGVKKTYIGPVTSPED